ncbi:MAG: DUF4249 family protein [Bacteroidetes bacterium]|nr:DUF4249 family protein [Bacteroidota bacterium]
MKRILIPVCSFLLVVLFYTGCDSVLPGDPGTLVIEAYLNVGQPLPKIRITRAASLSAKRFLSTTAIEGAEVTLTLDGQEYTYRPSVSNPVFYEPVNGSGVLVGAGASFELVVQVDSQTARATGITPPSIQIKAIRLDVSEHPVTAVLLDSLDIGLDSLNIGLNSRTGFIYPVQVAIDWVNQSEIAAENWVETRLQPITPFSSSIVDFFLLPSAIFPENSASLVGSGVRTWQGVYAVPVKKESDPIPIHTLRVALLRSGETYALHASSRRDPIGREPISNLTGAVGFVGGVSIDSLSINVPK